jgi:hypothetical protein
MEIAKSLSYFVLAGLCKIGGDPQVPGFAGFANGLEKDLIVRIAPEDPFPSSSPVQDMIPGVRVFYSQKSRHKFFITEEDEEPRVDLTPFQECR